METVQADEAAFCDSFPQQGYFSKVDASEEQMLCLDGLQESSVPRGCRSVPLALQLVVSIHLQEQLKMLRQALSGKSN